MSGEPGISPIVSQEPWLFDRIGPDNYGTLWKFLKTRPFAKVLSTARTWRKAVQDEQDAYEDEVQVHLAMQRKEVRKVLCEAIPQLLIAESPGLSEGVEGSGEASSRSSSQDGRLEIDGRRQRGPNAPDSHLLGRKRWRSGQSSAMLDDEEGEGTGSEGTARSDGVTDSGRMSGIWPIAWK